MSMNDEAERGVETADIMMQGFGALFSTNRSEVSTFRLPKKEGNLNGR